MPTISYKLSFNKVNIKFLTFFFMYMFINNPAKYMKMGDTWLSTCPTFTRGFSKHYKGKWSILHITSCKQSFTSKWLGQFCKFQHIACWYNKCHVLMPNDTIMLWGYKVNQLFGYAMDLTKARKLFWFKFSPIFVKSKCFQLLIYFGFNHYLLHLKFVKNIWLIVQEIDHNISWVIVNKNKKIFSTTINLY